MQRKITLEQAALIEAMEKSATGLVENTVNKAKSIWRYLPDKVDQVMAKNMFSAGTKPSGLERADTLFKTEDSVRSVYNRVAPFINTLDPAASSARVAQDLQGYGLTVTPDQARQLIDSIKDGKSGENTAFRSYLTDLVRRTSWANAGSRMGSGAETSYTNKLAQLAQGGLLAGGVLSALNWRRELAEDADMDEEMREQRRSVRMRKHADGTTAPKVVYNPFLWKNTKGYNFFKHQAPEIIDTTKDLTSRAGKAIGPVAEAGVEAIKKTLEAADTATGVRMSADVADGPMLTSRGALPITAAAVTALAAMYGGDKAVDAVAKRYRASKYRKHLEAARAELRDALRGDAAPSAKVANSDDPRGESPLRNTLIALGLLTTGLGFMGGKSLGQRMKKKREKDLKRALLLNRPRSKMELVEHDGLYLPHEVDELAAPVKYANSTLRAMEVLTPMVREFGAVSRAKEATTWAEFKASVAAGKQRLKDYAVDQAFTQPTSTSGKASLAVLRKVKPNIFDNGWREAIAGPVYRWSKENPEAYEALSSGVKNVFEGVQKAGDWVGRTFPNNMAWVGKATDRLAKRNIDRVDRMTGLMERQRTPPSVVAPVGEPTQHAPPKPVAPQTVLAPPIRGLKQAGLA